MAKKDLEDTRLHIDGGPGASGSHYPVKGGNIGGDDSGNGDESKGEDERPKALNNIAIYFKPAEGAKTNLKHFYIATRKGESKIVGEWYGFKDDEISSIENSPIFEEIQPSARGWGDCQVLRDIPIYGFARRQMQRGNAQPLFYDSDGVGLWKMERKNEGTLEDRTYIINERGKLRSLSELKEKSELKGEVDE